MKRKRLTSVILTIALLSMTFVPSIASAASVAKEEVVYGNLDYDGSLNKLYVVNIFNEENITDYGDYVSVKNLTTEDKIKQASSKISVKASETPFYYEGVLENKELPWDIAIDYSLNGNKCSAADLAGKSGRIEIGMSIKANDSGDLFFYENYALQISLTLDSNYCRNISAEGATIANVGSDKQITYTVLPGKGAMLTVAADVTSFEMSEISINGIKLNMDIDVDALGLTGEAVALEEGAAQLDEGAKALEIGAAEIKEGTEAVVEGVETLKKAISAAAYRETMLEYGLDIEEVREGNATLTKQVKILMRLGRIDDETGNAILTLIEGNNAAISGAETYLDKVQEEMEPMSEGATELTDGASELLSGINKLSEGTGKLKKETSGIDEEISEQISEITGNITGSDEKRSFVSKENDNVTSVQFVLKTESIEIEKEIVESAEGEEDKGLFARLIALFKKQN